MFNILAIKISFGDNHFYTLITEKNKIWQTVSDHKKVHKRQEFLKNVKYDGKIVR